MSKFIVRYLLNGNGSIPDFIENGGYFFSNEESVGLSVDDAKRYLPISVQKLTKAQLVTRAQSMPFKHEDGSSYSAQEMSDAVDAFLTEMGLPDYV